MFREGGTRWKKHPSRGLRDGGGGGGEGDGEEREGR